jgi:hypothetical protein
VILAHRSEETDLVLCGLAVQGIFESCIASFVLLLERDLILGDTHDVVLRGDELEAMSSTMQTRIEEMARTSEMKEGNRYCMNLPDEKLPYLV